MRPRRSDGEGLVRGENDGGSKDIPFSTEASFGIADLLVGHGEDPILVA